MMIPFLSKPRQDPYSAIPLDHPVLRRARELIPAELWPNTWVAGSAATRFGSHQDVDVWITGVPRTQDLSVLLGEPSKPMFADADEDYEHLAITIYNNPDEKLQIMACHDDIRQLLTHFDISVHCGAMHLITGEQLRGPGYGEKVLIINYIQERPVLTLTRYLSIAKRYKDFSGMFHETVQRCAADSFYLMTPAMMEQRLRDNYVDRGL
jgi:hypothetical protein